MLRNAVAFDNRRDYGIAPGNVKVRFHRRPLEHGSSLPGQNELAPRSAFVGWVHVRYHSRAPRLERRLVEHVSQFVGICDTPSRPPSTAAITSARKEILRPAAKDATNGATLIKKNPGVDCRDFGLSLERGTCPDAIPTVPDVGDDPYILGGGVYGCAHGRRLESAPHGGIDGRDIAQAECRKLRHPARPRHRERHRRTAVAVQ